MNDKQTAKSRCFGFITMKKESHSRNILRGEPHILDGKEIECKLAVPKNLQEQKKSSKKKLPLKEPREDRELSFNEQYLEQMIDQKPKQNKLEMPNKRVVTETKPTASWTEVKEKEPVQNFNYEDEETDEEAGYYDEEHEQYYA